MFLSVIIPTINEEKSIGRTIKSIQKSLKSARHEILIVDTNSTDKTAKIARSLGAKVINEPRRGYGRAYKTGFRHSRGDIIVTLDADSTYPVESVMDLVKVLESGCDFVSGMRQRSEGMSFLHRFGNLAITITANVLFFTHFKDSQSGMWVFRKSLIKEMNLTNDSWPFSGEIKIEAWRHGKFVEFPIVYRKRRGESKVRSWKVGWENIKFLFKKRFGVS
ncbi:MAG: glycosyltransferase family 2 protein [Candidatus Aenigmarchaeota archaeon]|nr:glycosyltransferase family 2 protein [Candidatus Aenigmarchaeota archaeon]